MSMIQLFRSYVREYHPYLASKEWKIGKKVLSVEDVTDDKDKIGIPTFSNQALICWLFFYDEKATDVVYLLQNKNDSRFITIGLCSKGKLVKPLILM